MPRLKLPLFFYIIFFMTAMVLAIGHIKMIFHISGWGWFLPLMAAMIVLLNKRSSITFPIILWLPWVFVVLVYLFFSDYSAWQRSAQLLCPIVIGMAASAFRLDEEELSVFIKYCHYLAVFLLFIAGLKSGLLLTGRLPAITGLAPEVITGSLLATLYATQYSLGYSKALYWWFLMAALPVIALTRTAIVAIGLTLPLNLGPLKISKRTLIIALICVIGVYVFYSPRVQHKMFYSGQGEMSDVLSEDFRTTGRFAMWEQFSEGIALKPWFGYGTGAGEDLAAQLTGLPASYPHNDWYLSLYDYGIFGTSVFALTILMFAVHLYMRARSSEGLTKCLFIAGASSYVPFVLFMFTDNIMVYASFFGNLQFAIIGLAYGSYMDYDEGGDFMDQRDEDILSSQTP